MISLDIRHITLPLQEPVLKVLVEIIIILFAPILLNKIKIPYLIGLIIGGAIVGPNGFNLLARDSGIVSIGTTGLLYLMFLAGLEIDMGDFKKNKWKSLTFGIYTFSAPMLFGYVCSYYLLGFSMLTSILFASLFSSHTLIAYPIVSKLGVAKNRAVNITVGGTIITDILALLVLAAVVGMAEGEAGGKFWLTLSISLLFFGLIVLFVFPIIARWFFKKVDDKISQYIFVLVIIYLAALLAEIAGIEAIIGAFLAGLALNRLIPRTSSLMNRVEFVGNAIFIPFFLISVGMIIDFKVFFSSWETLKVAVLMIVIAFVGKYIAAKATQKTFRLTTDEGGLIFGLSSASAAATLASVMVGYNIIIGETKAGEPVRLLNEHVLNGSILLILVSCTLSSFVSAAKAKKIAGTENEETVADNSHREENILMAVNNPQMVESMVNLAIMIKAKTNTDRIFALSIISEEEDELSEKKAEKMLATAVHTAAAADVILNPLLRYDKDVINDINNVVKEKKVTDLIMGIEESKKLSPSFIYNLYNGYLQQKDINVLVYHTVQPIATIKKHIVFISPGTDSEPGFFYVLLRIWNIARNSGTVMEFYSSAIILNTLKNIIKKVNIEAGFNAIQKWEEVDKVFKNIKEDEGVIIVMAKYDTTASLPQRHKIPGILNSYFSDKSYLLMYPYSAIDEQYMEVRSINNHGDFTAIGNLIGKIFK